MSALSPAAEHVLAIGLDRALDMIREGRRDDAERALTLSTDTANLIDVAERARIVGTDGDR
jgi:hypothetical protein